MKSLSDIKDKFVKERISVGLDIGTSVVKTVKLKFFKDTIELCGFDLQPAQLDLEPVLKKIAQSQEIRNINLSVCGPTAIIRYVNFPKMSEEELGQALKFEAEKYIPFGISEVILDSCILKHDLADNKMLVLLAAVKKETINQRLKLIEDSGLSARIVDIDSIALINAFNYNYTEDENIRAKTIALLNIGASLSNLNILENTIPRLSRDIHIAGNNITQKIEDILGIDIKAAEQLKINPKENLEKVTLATETVISNLAKEIRASFDYYESQSASVAVKIFLSGGDCMASGLKDMLVNLLGIEVEYWDPFRKINIANSILKEKLKSVSSQLAVAVGLALR
jgi:type IV pilus assembly protein PilM